MDEPERRIDRHLDESNELMRRIDASLARNHEALDRNQEALDRDRQAFLDLRLYLQQVATALGAMATELSAGRQAFVEETRAQRSALFAMIDRLNNEPPPNAA